MDNKRKASQVLNNNPHGRRLRGPKIKKDGRIVYKQILRNAKLQIGERGKKNS
jgi:hypothetical protein